LHNLTIKQGGMSLEELLRRMTLEAENEICLRELDRWVDAAELEN
jgi:hypothetical protein